jgi:hypothetical protein
MEHQGKKEKKVIRSSSQDVSPILSFRQHMGFQLVCYSAILFTTEVVDEKVDPDRRLAHLSSSIGAGGHVTVYLVKEACQSGLLGQRAAELRATANSSCCSNSTMRKN